MAADPAPTSAFLSAFADVAPAEVHGGVAEMDTPRGRLTVMTPGSYRARFGIEASLDLPSGPHIAAYCVDVSALEQTPRAVLDTAACRFALSDGALVVPPDVAYGVALVFRDRAA